MFWLKMQKRQKKIHFTLIYLKLSQLFLLQIFQDFEDWDDVGLNMPRPPDLLHLYKDFGCHSSPLIERANAECMACLEDEKATSLEEELARFKQEMVCQLSVLY